MPKIINNKFTPNNEAGQLSISFFFICEIILSFFFELFNQFFYHLDFERDIFNCKISIINSLLWVVVWLVCPDDAIVGA